MSIQITNLQTQSSNALNSPVAEGQFWKTNDQREPATVTEDDEMSKEKEIDKLMALISLSGTGYDHQRAVNVAGARENVGTPVVQKSGIQCYNCKEYGHVSRECQKPKRVKDAAYHKEKMLLCKQEEAGVQLNAEQADWKDDTDDESEEQDLVQNNNDNYNVFAMENEHPKQPESSNAIYLTELVTPIYYLIHRIYVMIDFAKPEFLKKAQRANPRLYDIGCYNDNLALMLTPDSDETIRLDKERRSKLRIYQTDLIMII
ncbi:integrase, catalytic region, zinc finger, CCHC-type containing protein [Tanacetum coccineum]